jgi:hypothetical protein
MRVRGRLQKLEQQRDRSRARAPCGSCGGLPKNRPLTLRVCGVEGEEPSGPDRCLRCGRVLVVRIEFDRAG